MTSLQAASQSLTTNQRTKSSVPDLVKKAVAAIHIKNDISCLQRKLWNVLLSNAYIDLSNTDIQFHEIRVKDLTEEVGFDSKNISYLKQALEDMVTTKLTWNILDEKGKQEWGVSAALASAVISGGMCYYSYSAHLRQKLHNPEFYAPVPLNVLRRFCGGHALALYENCLRYKLVSQTPFFPLDVFRDLIGVGDNNSYDDFKVLNRAVIKPSMQEVNSISDIYLEIELKREKRKVVAIKFLIDGNKQDSLPIEQSENFRPDLLAKLLDTFCLSDKQAKEVLVTHSEDRIIAVMQYVEEKYQAGKVKQGKIAPYFLNTLPKFQPAAAVSSLDRKKDEEKQRVDIIEKRTAEIDNLTNEFMINRAAQVETYCGGIVGDERQQLLDSFVLYLTNKNPGILTFYNRSGFKTKIVHTEFIKFVGDSILPPFEAALKDHLRKSGIADI